MSFLDDYKALRLGKRVDYNKDGSYQCVDEVKDYAALGGNPITTFGNAKDYGKPGGLGKGWTFFPYSPGMIPPRECIIVWGRPKGKLGDTYYGHIAIGGAGSTTQSCNTLAQNDATGNGKGLGGDAISVHSENYIGCLGFFTSNIPLSMQTTRKYGYIRDTHDDRDILYSVSALVPLPPSVDLRSECPPVYNQYQFGSCTANGIGGLFEFVLKKQGKPDFMPSRRFIYFNERFMEGTVPNDCGAQIRDGMKSIAQQGVCDEKDCPYTDNWADFVKRPTPKNYADARNHQAITYSRIVPTEQMMKQCLAQGYPFTCGISVYASFESEAVKKSGIVSMPTADEQLIGGHCIVCVGYDDSKKVWIMRNSWGTDWGMQGYFTLPYAYLTDRKLASDFWTLRTTE